MMLITGATGNVGRHAIDLLLAEGQQVRAVTRDASQIEARDGLEVATGDPSRPDSLVGAFSGADALLLSPRAAGAAVADLVALAAAEGVRQVIVISALTVQYPAGEERFIAQFQGAEAAARQSGMAWTMLRCADFDANALAWVPQVRNTGTVHGAYARAATSPIHERDIAAVALHAFRHDLVGEAFVLTGPESLTQVNKVAAIGNASGRPVSFVELDPDQLRAAMLSQGLPGEIADRLLGSLSDYADEPGPTTDTVEKLLGRPATPFSRWALENATAFA